MASIALYQRPFGPSMSAPPEQLVLAGAHETLLGRPLVIITENVQGAVHQQVRQLVIERVTGIVSLALRGLKRDDDLAELSLGGVRCNESRFRLKTEREDIGRLIDA